MLKKYAIRYFSVLLFFGSVSVFGQGGTCSETYVVESIPYAPPFDYATLDPVDGEDSNPNDITINITRDDYWSQVIDLDFDNTPDTPPFRFCFFGNFYDKALVNSNGAITFSVGGPDGNGGQYMPNQYVSWGFNGGIPYAGSDARTKLSIFGVLQDTDPEHHGAPYDPVTNPNGWKIQAKLTGNFPCRMMVFSIYNLGQFQCGYNVGGQTYQMVLYETSNVIEVYVENRTPCTTWNNGGQGLIGIQDETGVNAFYPENRNGGGWSAHQEAWRFQPDNILGLGEDQIVCESEEVVLTAFLTDLPGIAYQWYLDDDAIDGATSAIYRVPAGNSGTYRVVATAGGCLEVEDEVEVLFQDPPTINEEPDPLYFCDPSNGGHVEFTLSDANEDITLGDATLEVSYFGTYDNAYNNVDDLPDRYVNDDPWNDVVFARVKDPATGCFSIVELELQVGRSPVLVEPETYRLCQIGYNADDDYIYAEFDLTSREDEMLNGFDPDQVNFYYFEAEEDAIDAGERAIDDPFFGFAIGNPNSYVNVRNPQTVYALAVGNDNFTTPFNGGKGCFDIVPIHLIVDPTPDLAQLEPFEMCDDIESGSDSDRRSYFDLRSKEDEIADGDTSSVFTWYSENPRNNPDATLIGNPSAFLNTTTPQTVYAMATNNFECSSTISLTLIVNPVPKPAEPTPMELCDLEDNGIQLFELTEKDEEIINDGEDLEIKYYESQRLAREGGTEGLIVDGEYMNTRSPYNDIVWARVENTRTGCFTVIPVELIVNPLPDRPIEGFDDLTICDEGNAEEYFDLTINTPFVYGDQSTDDFKIGYHRTLDDAEEGIDRIGNPSRFLSSGQTIWVRLENIETGCFRISEFDLIIGDGPEINEPEDMALCDDEESGSTTDRVSIFNLRLNTEEITGGDSTLAVFYYASEEDQENDIPIQNTRTYANPTGADGLGITPYTIYISVFDEKGCATKTTLDLIVLPNPVVAEPEPLVICDEDTDGFAEFVLTDKDEEIINGNESLVITYHETMADAEVGELPLSSPYENIIRNRQTIYVRAEYALPPNESGCYTVVPLDLIVSPKPIVPIDLPELIACDPDGTGIAEFDLTENAPFIYGDQDQELLKLTYHLTEEEALEGVNRIATPESYRSSDRTIYVRLGFTEGDECFSIGQFEIRVAPQVQIVEPTPYDICNELGEPNDERASFDLTSKSLEITNRAPGLYVEYYLTQENAIDGVNRIDPEEDFVNSSNPQTVYARVTDDNTGCFTTTSLLLRVLANPEPVTPEPIEKCAVNLDDSVRFDLTIREAHILNGEDWDLTYFESYEDAVENTGRITNTTDYPNISNPQTIYVRATNKGRANELLCFEIVELELRVLQIPDQTAEISPYMICEINAGDMAEFDLTTKIPEILGELDPADYEVTFYLSARDAERKENRIRDPQHHLNKDWNGNTVNPQDIYVGVFMPGAECYTGGVQKFKIVVQEGVIATEPAEAFSICDNIQPSDGIAEFDLEDFSNQKVVDFRNEILSGQDPATYSLHFYGTYEDAEGGEEENRIVWPYINQINPQVIYARVTNEANIHLPKCHEIVEVILRVEEIPEIIFEEEYRLCVDGAGNPTIEESGEMSPPILDTDLNPGLFTFEWLHEGVILIGEEGSSLVAEAAGEYMVIATHIESGCTTEGSTTVVLSSPPTYFDAEVTSDAFSDLHVIEITATGEGEYEYNINGGPFQDDPIFIDVPEGNHTIVIRDKFGCGSVSIVVGAIDYPKFFTPNNDGYNDTWNIVGMSYIDPEAKIYVFDKFGKLLAQLTPHSEGWDGTYRGRDLPSSDYWFRVEYTEDGDRKEMKGHFTLKR